MLLHYNAFYDFLYCTAFLLPLEIRRHYGNIIFVNAGEADDIIDFG